MNTDLMFSSKSEDWETPADLFHSLDQEFRFDLDVCASPANAKCEKFFTKEDNGLCQPWIGTVWCNPPYGREIGKWVKKARQEATGGATVVMLIPARTDTRWFHNHIYKRNNVEIRFLKGRLKFGTAKNSAPFPSMVVVFRGTK